MLRQAKSNYLILLGIFFIPYLGEAYFAASRVDSIKVLPDKFIFEGAEGVRKIEKRVPNNGGYHAGYYGLGGSPSLQTKIVQSTTSRRVKFSSILKEVSRAPASSEENFFDGHAKTYLDYRSKKLGAEERAELFSECLFSHKNPFCPYLQDSWVDDAKQSREEAEKRSDGHRLAIKLSSVQLAKKIEQGDLAGLDGISRSLSYSVFRKFSGWTKLEKSYARAVNPHQACLPPQFLMAFGLKAEEYFPERKYRNAAINLYRRASQCGYSGLEAVDVARYRLALLYVWDSQYKLAIPYFESVTSGEFASRAHFWLAYSFKKMGNSDKHFKHLSGLIRENPLGYHALTSSVWYSYPLHPFADQNETHVLLRSENEKELNPLVGIIESLQKIGANVLAEEFIEELGTKIGKTEPEFQLYYSYLARKNRSFINEFKVLSVLMRTSPNLIANETLKLYYPREYFKEVTAAKRDLDPYLVLALVRQESAFSHTARSPAGALGLMQLMPQTARTMAKVSTKGLLIPKVNLKLGVKFLSKLLDRFDGDTELALAAYNAGPEKVDDWQRRYPISNRMLFLDLIPFNETRNYVVLIARNYFWYLSLYGSQVLYLSNFSGKKHPPTKKVEFKGIKSL